MTDTGLDYSFSHPDLDTAWNAGYRFVSRYLSWLPNAKVITAAEYQALLAKGFQVSLNWEYGAKDQLDGAPSGKLHAAEAVKQARALGYPAGSTIYFSADFDVTEAQQTAVNAYMLAAKAVVHAAGYRIGIYGGYYVVKRAFDSGVTDDGWQTYAWSGGQWDARAEIRQDHNGITCGGADCDHNTRVGTTYLAGRPTAAPPAPVKTPAPPKVTPATIAPGAKFPLPADQYYGNIGGPAASHGGGLAADKPIVAAIQKAVGASVDGQFGPDTIAKVEAWQKSHGLAADGQVGPATWAKLFPASAAPKVTPAAIAPGAKFPLPADQYYGLATGPAASHGGAVAKDKPIVAAIQKAVGASVDGDFGSGTLAKVEAWQKSHGLAVDGHVGPATWAKLFPAKPAPKAAAVAAPAAAVVHAVELVAAPAAQSAPEPSPAPAATVAPAPVAAPASVPATAAVSGHTSPDPAPEGASSAVFTSAYWRYVAERSSKTFVQTFVALLGVGQTNMISVNWGSMAATAGGAALVSVLTSISVLTGSTTAEPTE
jgi:peptidoglycan hydrolase-like protein with peptidoglycan-binding domain